MAEIVKLLIADAAFLAVCIVVMLYLRAARRSAYAVARRNFVGYFSNPTGYVFLCLFVLLSSFAAFWPHEFFNSNLANLAQLNYYFPFIMLVFIPAITMSIWAEERRQGTDELLLTMPAGDFDIVMGKYLAAAAIFTASLFFSQLSNFIVLSTLALGDIDTGHFVATYAGYWLMGLAMIAVGMVASFLTSNLTVGFILGALFNAPLAFLVFADVIIPGRGFAQLLSEWSFSSKFRDFGRGVLGLGSVTYFVMIVVAGLYLSMVLIGKRHWSGGRDGESRLGHYIVRALCLAVIGVAATVFFTNNEWIRHDATSEKISSLSPDTRKLISELQTDHPVRIEAFLSNSVPESYVKTKVDLASMLREFQAIGRGKVDVTIHDNIELSSDAAARAEEQYGITPTEPIMIRGGGEFREEEFILGAAFTCGLEKVVVPFFDVGIPIEYELVRSIGTVADTVRRKIGIVRTDVQLFGGFDMQRMAPRPKELIVEELEKQYDVEEVDPSSPIEVGRFDVLLVVQPSSLTQPLLDNLTDAIKQGQPTAIFEDPFPAMFQAPGTGQPRMPAGGGGMMGMRQPPPEPKGNIRKLWTLLGMDMIGQNASFGGGFDAEVIWQKYNPYPKVSQIRHISHEWVFVGPGQPGGEDPLNSSQSITSNLNQLLFLYPGAVQKVESSGLSFTSLVTTGDQTGTIRPDDIRNQQGAGQLEFQRKSRYKRYVLAARIKGAVQADMGMPAEGDSEEGASSDNSENETSDSPSTDSGPDASTTTPKELDVVYVSDIDLLSSQFLMLRARPMEDVNWEFDNVTFVLNILDTLAGDDRFVEIRKRKTRYPTLKLVEQTIADARSEASSEIAKFQEKFESAQADAKQRIQKASSELDAEVKQLQTKLQETGEASSQPLQAAMRRLAVQRDLESRRLEAETERLRREQKRDLKRIQRGLDSKIRSVRSSIKLMTIGLPVIPPLLLGLVVFFSRKSRERESITTARRR